MTLLASAFALLAALPAGFAQDRVVRADRPLSEAQSAADQGVLLRDALRRQPDDPAPYFKLAKLARDAGRLDEALAWIRAVKSIAKEPGASARAEVEELLFVDALRQQRATNPESPARVAARAAMAAGVKLAQADAPRTEAESRLTEALRLDATFAEPLFNLAVLADRHGDVAVAIRRYEEYIAAAPTMPQALTAEARIAFLRPAPEAPQAPRADDSELYRSCLELASTAIEAGQRETAIAHLTAASQHARPEQRAKLEEMIQSLGSDTAPTTETAAEAARAGMPNQGPQAAGSAAAELLKLALEADGLLRVESEQHVELVRQEILMVVDLLRRWREHARSGSAAEGELRTDTVRALTALGFDEKMPSAETAGPEQLMQALEARWDRDDDSPHRVTLPPAVLPALAKYSDESRLLIGDVRNARTDRLITSRCRADFEIWRMYYGAFSYESDKAQLEANKYIALEAIERNLAVHRHNTDIYQQWIDKERRSPIASSARRIDDLTSTMRLMEPDARRLDKTKEQILNGTYHLSPGYCRRLELAATAIESGQREEADFELDWALALAPTEQRPRLERLIHSLRSSSAWVETVESGVESGRANTARTVAAPKQSTPPVKSTTAMQREPCSTCHSAGTCTSCGGKKVKPESCRSCDGTGDGREETCNACLGLRKVNCSTCGARGEVSKRCSTCVNGKIDCEGCGGTGGRAQCSHCGGDGRTTCLLCNGTGTYHGVPCTVCGAAGDQECVICDGRGKEPECYSCDGSGREKCTPCNGTGERTERCATCTGDRQITCRQCAGDGSTATRCTHCKNGKVFEPCSICDQTGRCTSCSGQGVRVVR